jgi:hypothetical protein
MKRTMIVVALLALMGLQGASYADETPAPTNLIIGCQIVLWPTVDGTAFVQSLNGYKLFQQDGARTYLLMAVTTYAEFAKVDRAGRGVVALGIVRTLQNISDHYGTVSSCFQTPSEEPTDLVEQWNRRFKPVTRFEFEADSSPVTSAPVILPSSTP